MNRRKKRKPPSKKVLKSLNDDMYNYMWGPSEFHATGTLKGYDRTKDLGKIKVPTLYVCGRFDESTPEANRLFAKKTPNAQLKIIPKSSHGIARENPKAFEKVVPKFLRSTENEAQKQLLRGRSTSPEH